MRKSLFVGAAIVAVVQYYRYLNRYSVVLS